MISLIKPWFLPLVVLFCQLSQAQKVYLGAKLGPNIGGPLGKTDGASGKPIPGFDGSFSFQFFLAEKMFIQPEIGISRRCANYSATSSGDTLVSINIGGVEGKVPATFSAVVNGQIRLTYVEVPIKIGYQTAKGFFVLGGPYVSKIIGGSDKGNIQVEIGLNNFGSDYKEYDNVAYINSWETGARLGGGWAHKCGIMISAECSRSFVPFYKADFYASRNQPYVRLYNTFFQMQIGYRFGFN